jgi:transcriptional regulator with AAA-type ATPase domain
MGTSTTNDSTLEEDVSARSPAGTRNEPHLFLLFEGTRPSAGGARHTLYDVERVMMGRARARKARRFTEEGNRTLDLGVPDRRMSTGHASLVRGPDGDSFTVEDLGSTNGSRVNGHALRGRVELHDGDVLETGRTHFLFQAALPTGPADPLDVDAMDLESERPELRTLVPERAMLNAALKKIAASKVPVLVTGPTGSGKELTARAVHEESGRSGPFIAVNAGALPQALVESQLFGHVRGAFTGALRDELGFVRSADGGTLFLDEIADLPLPAQAALLRVLQEGEVTAVGSPRAVKVDVRIVAATNADLEARCRGAVFREDLLARLAGYTFELPALRDRHADLGVLVASVLSRTGARVVELSPDVGRALALYPWPRNVRELEQVLSAAAALAAPAGILELTHLPDAVALLAHARGAPPRAVTSALAPEAELRRSLVALLGEHRGNITEVARAMGKARMQIQRWAKRFAIDVDSFRR